MLSRHADTITTGEEERKLLKQQLLELKTENESLANQLANSALILKNERAQFLKDSNEMKEKVSFLSNDCFICYLLKISTEITYNITRLCLNETAQK